MKTTKRLLGIVLALAMLLTMASFPAFAADEGYTYTPKNIVLEASVNPDKAYNEPKIIARPSNLNIYVGDKLVLPEGGLTLAVTPKTISAANSPTGAAVTPTGFVIDVFQSYGNLYKTETTQDGIKRFYFAYDSAANKITGIYPTMADMVAGTNERDGITLGAEGLWAVGMGYAIYHTSASDAGMYRYASGTETTSTAPQYYSFDDASNTNFSKAPYSFFLNVKAAPTTADYEVSAPAVSADITTASLTSGTDFEIYARTFTADTSTYLVSEVSRNIMHSTSNKLAGSMMGWGIDFASPAYLESLKISFYTTQFYYTVYGSLDGENWYQIKEKTATTTGTRGATFTVNVGGIAKYFRIELLDYAATLWGYNNGHSTLGTVTGKLNVLEGNTVTVTGATSATLTTDANGKVDLSTVLADCPVGEYTYKIDGVDVTNKIADYIFTGATTVTVEEYVEPAGPLVTFTDGTTKVEVYADENGYYEIPAAFQGDFSFYADANYKTKIDTTAPVAEETTVYVKAIQWTHTAKTVEFKIKNTPSTSSISFTNANNGPFVAPRETIYVGDTMVIYNSEYKDLVAGIDGAVELTKIGVYGRRYGTEEGDTGKLDEIYTWEGVDITHTFTKPGIYSLLINSVRYKTDPDSTTTTRDGTMKSYNCVFEVLPAPTSAPKSTVAPEYTGTAGTVEALLTNDFNTSVAFKEVYCGETVTYTSRVFAITDAMTTTATSGCTRFLQFNLPSLSYVDNVVIGAKDSNSNACCPIYDYDAYGSMDGENWYLLNSDVTTSGTYNVGGVANYVRIVPRQTDGWWAQIDSYSVNGYAVSENAVDTTPNPIWLKEGEKVEITSEVLPVAYASGDKNYAITGWKVDAGHGLNDVSLAVLAERNLNELGTLVPVVTEVPVNASALTGTLAPAGDDITDGKTFSGNYINGFYVEGTQIRIPEGEGETAIKGGLRFVNIMDNALIAELESAETVASYEYGTLAMASTKYTGGDLVIGYNQYTKQVVGERIFASADEFEDKYFKYTVCVTGIGEANYTKDVMVRPYLTITMTDGSSVTLYGEQYATSIYDAAVFALAKGGLTSEEEAHLQSIVDAVE